MATFEKRGPYQIRAKIRRHGHRTVTKTFNNMADAKKWARKTESQIDQGIYIDTTEAQQTTLAEALERYLREITPQKKGAKQETQRIMVWLKHQLAVRSLATIRGVDIAAYRDEQVAAGKASNTIRLELAIISHLFEVARKEWGMESLGNPVQAIRKPALPGGRDRRLVDDEEVRLLAAAEACKSREIDSIIVMALETGARREEIFSMTWGHINLPAGTWHIPLTKNSEPRTVPLTDRAVETLQGLPRRIDGKVWSLKRTQSITQAFERVCKRAKIENLRFHDLRHEATSRFFERGLNMMEVAAITGHKSLSMLKRYTHLRAEDLRAKLRAN